METIPSGVLEMAELILTTDLTNIEIGDELNRSPYTIGIVRSRLTQADKCWDDIRTLNDDGFMKILNAPRQVNHREMMAGGMQ